MELPRPLRDLADTLRAFRQSPTEGWQEVARLPGEKPIELLPVAAVFAAVPPLVGALQGLFYLGLRGFLFGLLRAPFLWAISLGAVFAVAHGLAYLAPRLQAPVEPQNAMKVLAWGLVPYWASSVAGLIPYLPYLAHPAGVVATCYLWFFGFPLLLETPRNPPTTLALLALGAGSAYALLVTIAARILGLLF